MALTNLDVARILMPTWKHLKIAREEVEVTLDLNGWLEAKPGEIWTCRPVICAVCSTRWIAVVVIEWRGEPSLECPSCESFSGVVEELEGR